eukprot:507150-Alexandrium_andersonii.AAC.1
MQGWGPLSACHAMQFEDPDNAGASGARCLARCIKSQRCPALLSSKYGLAFRRFDTAAKARPSSGLPLYGPRLYSDPKKLS